MVAFLATKPEQHVLDQLFVSPDAKGKGLGTRLLRLAVAEMPGGFRLRHGERRSLRLLRSPQTAAQPH